MYCGKCGTLAAADATFCSKCGTPIAAGMPEEPPQAPSADPADSKPSSPWLYLVGVLLVGGKRQLDTVLRLRH